MRRYCMTIFILIVKCTRSSNMKKMKARSRAMFHTGLPTFRALLDAKKQRACRHLSSALTSTSSGNPLAALSLPDQVPSSIRAGGGGEDRSSPPRPPTVPSSPPLALEVKTRASITEKQFDSSLSECLSAARRIPLVVQCHLLLSSLSPPPSSSFIAMSYGGITE